MTYITPGTEPQRIAYMHKVSQELTRRFGSTFVTFTALNLEQALARRITAQQDQVQGEGEATALRARAQGKLTRR